MQDKERWLELCELLAKEQDPTKFLHYAQEIDRLLAERQQKVDQRRNPPPAT